MLEILKALFLVIVAGLLRFLGVTRKRIEPLDPAIEEMRKRGYDPKTVKKIVPDKVNQQLSDRLSDAVISVIQSDDQLGQNPFSEEEEALFVTSVMMAAGMMDNADVRLRPTFSFLGSADDQVLKVTFYALESDGKVVEVKNMIGQDTISLRGRPATTGFIIELVRLAAQTSALDPLVEEENSGQ